jgi:hypothetical protein
VTAREFFEKLDKLELTELHVLFLEHLRKDVLHAAWNELQERASLLIIAADLPAEVREQVLEPAEPSLPSWAWAAAALRPLGVDINVVEAEEAIALLCHS